MGKTESREILKSRKIEGVSMLASIVGYGLEER